MRYFKKFADFCSGLAAFSGSVYLLLQYLKFKVDDAETEIGLIEKIKLYFSKTDQTNNYLMLLLIAFFALSVAVSCILPRLPSVSFAFTLLPLALSFDMLRGERLKTSPMLYVLLACIATVGALYECHRRDRETGGRQGSLANGAASLLAAGFCFFVWYKQRNLCLLEEIEVAELDFFDREIYNLRETTDMKILLALAITFAVIAVLLVVFKDVYFIGPILTAPPAVAAVYFWNVERITAHAEVVVFLSAVAFITSLVGMFFGVATPSKKRRTKRG